MKLRALLCAALAGQLCGCGHLKDYERVYTASFTTAEGNTASASAHFIPPKRPAK